MPNLKREDSAKSIKSKIQQDLERRILHGMASEWEAAWRCLDPDKQQLIRRPTFAIKELKNQWGTWSPQKREIALSRRLVLNYPWDSIRDVLLHEMAHQTAQQLWGASAQMPHGSRLQTGVSAASHRFCGIRQLCSASGSPAAGDVLCA